MRYLRLTLTTLLLGAAAPLAGQQSQHAWPETAAATVHFNSEHAASVGWADIRPSRWQGAVRGAKIGAIAGGVIAGGYFVYEFYLRDQCPASEGCQKVPGGLDLRPVGLVLFTAVGAAEGALIGGLVGLAIPSPGRISLVAALNFP